MLDWRSTGAGGFGERANNRLFSDLLLAVVGTLCLIVAIIIFVIGIKKQDEENQRNRGNVRVEVIWPNEMNVDIDTWVKAPGDTPVGYSNLNGRVFNLHRDDLGNHADQSGINYEVATSRGIPPGEWVVNLHWYSNSQGASSVPVKVLITLKKNDGEASKETPTTLLTKTIVLERVTQEYTVVRFKTNDDMEVIKDSIDFTPLMIRAYDSSGDHAGG